MDADQPTQDEIKARLAQISKAVEEKLASQQKGVSREEAAARLEQNRLATATCPLDPLERLLCDSCQ
jgi:Ser-tRNA(Ala) deacylase AlaX